MGYLEIMLLAMLPLTELRGAIPIGIAMDLNPIAVYIASVIGSTIVSVSYTHLTLPTNSRV